MKVTDITCDPVLLPAAPPAAPAGDERAQLRAANGVRALEPGEEGLPIRRAPNGVYGFTYAPATETPVFATRAYHAFEVHKLTDGRDYVIGYVADEDAARLDNAPDGTELKIYPDPASGATRLVMLAMSRLQRSNAKAAREDGNPILFRVFPE